jgi:hypothetical protein
MYVRDVIEVQWVLACACVVLFFSGLLKVVKVLRLFPVENYVIRYNLRQFSHVNVYVALYCFMIDFFSGGALSRPEKSLRQQTCAAISQRRLGNRPGEQPRLTFSVSRSRSLP